jgi:hypothetical protein
LKNKFEYGLDQKGGVISGIVENDPAKYNECLEKSAIGHE